MSGKGLIKADGQLWQRVLQTIRPFPLSSLDTRLLVGVSGGADSLALLHLLRRQLGSERLIVAHLNHGLREAAEDEAAFVRQTAAGWGIRCIIEHQDVASLAQKKHLSLEAAARQVRYRFFARQAQLSQAKAVVVAHHADDQAETVLLHLLRGSGSKGLRGMLPLSRLPGTTDMWLLRPFLNISRSEIDDYCARHNLAGRHDSSNDDINFTRNRLRHELLPLLKAYNPQISTRLQQLATVTADDYAVLQAQFDQIFPNLVAGQTQTGLILFRDQFVALHPAWQRMALRRAAELLRPSHTDIGFKTVEQARLLILADASGRSATLPGRLNMRVEASEILFGEGGASRQMTFPQLATKSPVPLPVPGKVALGNGWELEAFSPANVSQQTVRQNKEPWQAFVSLGESEQLWIRPFFSGERFQPLGLEGRRQKIKTLLSNRKIRQSQRSLWPVVATENHPVWIIGLQLDERARVTGKSRRIVQLNCFRKKIL